MAEHLVAFDDALPAGQRFPDAAVRAEVQELAPSVVGDGDITTAKLDDDAVTDEKIADNAVRAEHLNDDAVEQAAIADGAVGSNQLQDDAVTLAKVGVGAVGATDKTGTARTLTIAGPFTQAEYGALTPDTNTLYVIT